MVSSLPGAGASLVVRAAGWHVAIPVESVVETMRPLPTEPLADLPRYLLGVARIRGQGVVVVDLGALLHGTGDQEGHQPTRYVVLEVDRGRQVALAVAAISGVVDLAARASAPCPPLLTAAPIEGLLSADRQLLAVLERTRLVSEEAWAAVDRAAADPAAVDGERGGET